MVRLSLLTLVLAWKGVSSFTVPPLRSATTASVDSSSSNKKSSNNSSSRLYLARRKSSAEAPKDKSDDSAESSAKKAALDGVLNQIERAYGRGSVMRLGDAGQMKVSMISTGSLTLDAATGGGYPRGRVVEIYGPESSGKTTLALHAIAQVQKEGGTAAFIDAEHALDPSYAAGCGVMVDDLLVSQPDSGEMALDVVDQLVRSAAVDVIVVDSVAALVPRAELEGDMSDTQMFHVND